MRWRIAFDKYWIQHNDSLGALRRHGYGVGAHETMDGEYVYVLERDKEIILETKDLDELNNVINLILPPRATKGEST